MTDPLLASSASRWRSGGRIWALCLSTAVAGGVVTLFPQRAASSDPPTGPASEGAEIDAVEIVRQKLAALQQAGPVHLQRDAEGRMTPDALAANLGRLSAVGGGQEMERAVADLAAQGDAVVAEIERRLTGATKNAVFANRVVPVLHAVNSEKSRELLRRMAVDGFGGGNESTARSAARILIDLDADQAWGLLDSSTPLVIADSLNTAGQQTIDGARMAKLVKLTQHDDWLVKFRAAEVLADGVQGPMAVEALGAVGRLLEQIKDHPDRDVVIPSRFGSLPHTTGEDFYMRASGVLFRIQVDDEALRILAQQQHGPAQDAVYFALAGRGDASVHDRIVSLLQDPTSPMNRKRAADAMRVVGTRADLSLLRVIAETDPYDLGVQRRGSDTPPQFPVRVAVKDAITTIQQRLGPQR